MLDAEQSEIAIPNSSCVQRGSEFEETNLNEEIAALWSAHHEGKAAAKRTNAELKILRRNLGERLFQLKSLLVRSGRGGGWSAYLRSHKLPRATADRYVREHEAVLNPPQANCLSDAISEPTEAGVSRFFNRLLPRLRTALISQQAVFDFVCHLLVDLPGVDGDVTDSAVEIYRPTPEDVPAQPLNTRVPMSASMDL